MSSPSIDKEDNEYIKVDNKTHQNFNSVLNDVVIPFSDLIKTRNNQDIYNGNEKIPFKKRHPVFKAFMKIEFEDGIRDLSIKQRSR
ncbi:MAG: hypothetical protein WBH31_10160 [Promethearchaeia archaeon]